MFVIDMRKCLKIYYCVLYAEDKRLFILAQGNLAISSSYNSLIANGLTVNVNKIYFYVFQEKQKKNACSFQTTNSRQCEHFKDQKAKF